MESRPLLKAYRFQWFSSFHGVLDVTVERHAEGCIVEVDYWLTRCAYEPVREWGHAEWKRLEAAMTLARFWSPREPQELWGLDGATWQIDGWKPDRHHAVRLWSPDDPYVRSVGRTFADLAGLPDIQLY